LSQSKNFPARAENLTFAYGNEVMAKILNNIVEDNAGFFRKTFPVSKELDSGKWKWLSNQTMLISQCTKGHRK